MSDSEYRLDLRKYRLVCLCCRKNVDIKVDFFGNTLFQKVFAKSI